MPPTPARDVIIIGAGIAGIAAAYYLTRADGNRSITLIDAQAPMSFTSAQSGENYRNWWPNRTMTEFIDHSIDLLEQIVHDSASHIRLTQRGYALATREQDIEPLLRGLHAGYADNPALMRICGRGDADTYLASLPRKPNGVDIVTHPAIIRRAFPALDPDVRTVIHIRRAGDLDSYQLSQHFLQELRARGVRIVRSEVTGIEQRQSFHVALTDKSAVEAKQLVVTAGPFVNRLLAHIGEQVPVRNILQQKFAFEDVLQVVPRDQPFTVDIDSQRLDWTSEERAVLADDEQLRYLTEVMPGNVHRRPDGGHHRRWLKLGWALNRAACEPEWSPILDDHFPEIVLRGAARLNPALRAYYDRLPAARSHYGGYYTMTEENLPIIGPLATEGAFVITALSGFGTMAACAAGNLCACWILGSALPDYANRLSLQRYADADFMTKLTLSNDRGVL